MNLDTQTYEIHNNNNNNKKTRDKKTHETRHNDARKQINIYNVYRYIYTLYNNFFFFLPVRVSKFFVSLAGLKKLKIRKQNVQPNVHDQVDFYNIIRLYII